MADTSGGNSVDAFRRDCAVGFAYQKLGEYPVSRSENPTSDLTSGRRKLITGYSRFGSWQSKAGPFSYAFSLVEGDFYAVEGVSLGAGGSGGGLWTSSGAQWKLSAIYVAGLDMRAGDSSNLAGVVALSPEKWNLLIDAKSQITERPPVITSYPEEVEIKLGISDEIRIEFSGFPFPKVQWESRSPTGVIDSLSGSAEGLGFAVLRFNTENLFANGTAFRVTLSNKLGNATSDWISIHYAERQIPYFEKMPTDMVLDTGESGVFEATIEAYPPADLQWQVLTESGIYEDLFDMRGLTGSRSARLEIPADNTYFANNTFRLRARNPIGTAYSDPVRLTIPISELGGQYLGEANEHLALNASFSIGTEVFNEYGGHHVVWRITLPTESYQEYEEGQDFPPLLSWIAMEGDIDSGYRVRVTNDGSILKGTVLQAVIIRPRENLSHLNVEDAFALPPIVLSVDGDPRIYGLPEIAVDPETGYGVRQYFSASDTATVEWQLWDAQARVWRPVDLNRGWAVKSSGHFSQLFRLKGVLYARVRAVLREQDGGVDQSEALDLLFPERGSDTICTFRSDLQPNSEVIGSTAYGGGVVTLLRSNDSGEYRLVFIAHQGEDWDIVTQKIALPEVFRITSFDPIAGDDGFIALGNSQAPGEEGIMAGSVLILKRDLAGRWRVSQELRIPEQEYSGGFPYDLKMYGKTLIAGSLHSVMGTPFGNRRRMHFFHLQSDGRFVFVDSIKKGRADLPETWSDYARPPLPFDRGFLVGEGTHVIPPSTGPTEASHDLLYVEIDEDTWSLKVSNIGKTMVTPDVVVDNREVWSLKYWQQGMTLHRVRIDESMTIESDLAQLAPEYINYLTASDGTIFRTKRSTNDSTLAAHDPVTFYRLNADGQIEGPATMLPYDWDSSDWPYSGGEVYFTDEHIYVLHSRGGMLRVDVEAKRNLWFSKMETTNQVWTQVIRSMEGQTWYIRFRKARWKGPKVEVQYSSDCKTWQVLPESESSLIRSNIDGDGDWSTGLWEIEVPVKNNGDTVLYRIVETP